MKVEGSVLFHVRVKGILWIDIKHQKNIKETVILPFHAP